MKFLFFITLLINIVFFLWEFNAGGLNSAMEIAGIDSHKTKQILLVSELLEQDEGNNIKIVQNNNALYDPIVYLELNSGANNKIHVDAEERSLQLIKSITTVSEEIPENLLSSNEQPQSEQHSLQRETDSSTASEQINNVPINPVLEDKSLIVESQEEVIVDSLLIGDESNVKQAVLDNNYCYHVGPFADQDALSVWHKINEIDAGSVTQFNKGGEVVSGYLLYYPVAETHAESKNISKILKQQGITDSWLFRKGKLKGAISIAMFKKKNRALRLQETLVKSGLATELKEQYEVGQMLYAEISTKDKTFKDTVIISDKQAVSECKNITGEAFVRE